MIGVIGLITVLYRYYSTVVQCFFNALFNEISSFLEHLQYVYFSVCGLILAAQLAANVTVDTPDDGSTWQVILEYQTNGVMKNITSANTTLSFYSTFASMSTSSRLFDCNIIDKILSGCIVDVSVGTPSVPAFTSPVVNGTMYFLTTSSSVSFAPVLWVTLQSLTLVNENDANDTIPLTGNMSVGSAQGINVVDFTPYDDGTQWVAVAVYSIGSVLNVTRTSGIATLHFFELFKSILFVCCLNL